MEERRSLGHSRPGAGQSRTLDSAAAAATATGAICVGHRAAFSRAAVASRPCATAAVACAPQATVVARGGRESQTCLRARPLPGSSKPTAAHAKTRCALPRLPCIPPPGCVRRPSLSLSLSHRCRQRGCRPKRAFRARHAQRWTKLRAPWRGPILRGSAVRSPQNRPRRGVSCEKRCLKGVLRPPVVVQYFGPFTYLSGETCTSSALATAKANPLGRVLAHVSLFGVFHARTPTGCGGDCHAWIRFCMRRYLVAVTYLLPPDIRS